jgi:phosphoglycolate phosphatase
MVKYILFDFDGTLVDSRNAFISVFNQLAVKYGYRTIDANDFKYLMTLSIAARCKFLEFPIYKIPFFISEAYMLFKNEIKHLILVDGIRDVLTELEDRGYEIGIISSNAESNIREFLLLNEIHHFKKITCSSNIFGKGSIIRSFLRANNLQNSEVMYVGDEVRDIIASRRNGVKVAWVSWGYDEVELVMKARPDYVVHTPLEILNLIS